MSEYLGPVLIPDITATGTFPIAVGYSSLREIAPEVVTHRFGAAETLREQRFFIGNGSRRFTVSLDRLSATRYATLAAFFESRKGSYQPFTLHVDDQDGGWDYTVRWETPELQLALAADGSWSGSCSLVEVQTTTPTYGVASTDQRFPSTSLKSAMLSQAQEVIPLVKVTAGATVIYISDRRCNVGAQLYQPRLLNWDGISQDMGGAQDRAQFTLGNADRVLTSLANQVDLCGATVEFSIFHVGTTIKLDLWKGEIESWSGAAADEFVLSCDDGLPQRFTYPDRKISRQDGFVVPDQPVSVGGKKGISRITATSIINDTCYGKPLRDIYINNGGTPLPVDCDVVCGRDESEFYAALGVVGRGPISAYRDLSDTRFLPTLDGQPNHGPGYLGLRRSYGGNPSTGSETLANNAPDAGSDSFTLDAVGSTPVATPGLTGAAFLQIRRQDEKGIQPLRPQDKKMQAWITGGLGGWTWTAPSARSWTTSLTNPVWIAINALLRVRVLQAATAATQEAEFDCAAAIAAAALCDQSVTKIIGTGSETQFRFSGVIADEKPLRDWLNEILACCLGYWYFAYGKLKIGIRINASATEAFTDGNALYNALSLAARRPQFDDLTVSFADEDYAYQANTVNLRDTSAVARVGVLKANSNVAGVVSKSQAARICTVAMREQLGGVTSAEQLASRAVSDRTTILALAVEPGMVVSRTSADAPGGAVKYRVKSWRLNKDWSIDIAGESVVDSMYDLTTGPKPVDVAPDAIPGRTWYNITLGGVAGAVATPLGYGAVGNGIVDDTTAVQAFLTANSAGEIPDGYTFLCGPLTVSGKTNFSLAGGGTIKRIADATTTPLLTIGTTTGSIFVGGMTLDGAMATQTGAANNLTITSGALVELSWVTSIAAKGRPLSITAGATAARISDCNFDASLSGSAPEVLCTNYTSYNTRGIADLRVPLATPPVVTAPTFVITGTGDIYGIDSTWSNPSPVGTAVGTERRLWVYTDAGGTALEDFRTIGNESSIDVAKGNDGGDCPRSAVGDRWLKFGVRTVNYEGTKSAWTYAGALQKLDMAVSGGTGNGLADLTMDASYGGVSGYSGTGLLWKWNADGSLALRARYRPPLFGLAGSQTTNMIGVQAYVEDHNGDVEGSVELPYTGNATATDGSQYGIIDINIGVPVAGLIYLQGCVVTSVDGKQAFKKVTGATPPGTGRWLSFTLSTSGSASVNPQQPASGDWGSPSILQTLYSQAAGIQRSQVSVPVPATQPSTVTYYEAWAYQGAAAPSDQSLYTWIGESRNGTAVITWLDRDQVVDKSYWFILTAANARTRFVPSSTSAAPAKSLTIPKWGVPAAPTGVNVTMGTAGGSDTYRVNNGVKQWRAKLDYTAPVASLDYFYTGIDAKWVDPTTGADIGGTSIYQRILGPIQSGPQYTEWFDYRAAPSGRRKLRFYSVDHSDSINETTPTGSIPGVVEFLCPREPESDGMDGAGMQNNTLPAVKIKTSDMGKGVILDPVTLQLRQVAGDSDNMLSNPGFEDGSKGWLLLSGAYVTVNDGFAWTGQNSLILPASNATALADAIAVRPWEEFYLDCEYQNTGGGLLPSASLYLGVQMLDAAGAHPAYGQTNGLACFQEQVFIMV